MTEHFYSHLQVLEGEKLLSDEERLKAAAGPLLSWYEQNARSLPWRDDPTPYRVWISEIMLQQTRVEAVKPYFARFMEALPQVQALAEVEDERLMKLWEGLGYYSRARNLKKAAQQIVEQYGGQLPAKADELLKLPGIGSYTAGAIASIAFGIPAPAVDGNVLRVLSRLFASRGDIRKPAVKTGMEELLKPVIPKENPGAFNQALIEIGAIVCLPSGEPRCEACPLSSLCLARRQGLLKEIPVRSPLKKRREEKRTVFVIRRGNQVALRKRPKEGLLADLYELPNLSGWIEQEEALRSLHISKNQVVQIEKLPDSKHIFSHIEWHMRGFLIRLNAETPSWNGAEEGCFFVEERQVRDVYALPGAFSAYTRLLEDG